LRWNGSGVFRFRSSSAGGVGVGTAGVAAFLGRLLATAAAAPLAVEASAENGDDREDVVGELLLGGVCVVCVHDDRRAVLPEYELDKLVCEAAEAVSVGNVH